MPWYLVVLDYQQTQCWLDQIRHAFFQLFVVSHYLNQCWFLITHQWGSVRNLWRNLKKNAQNINYDNILQPHFSGANELILCTSHAMNEDELHDIILIVIFYCSTMRTGEQNALFFTAPVLNGCFPHPEYHIRFVDIISTNIKPQCACTHLVSVSL